MRIRAARQTFPPRRRHRASRRDRHDRRIAARRSADAHRAALARSTGQRVSCDQRRCRAQSAGAQVHRGAVEAAAGEVARSRARPPRGRSGSHREIGGRRRVGVFCDRGAIAMIRRAFALLLLFALQGSAAAPRVVGYYAGWNREYTPDKIPADKLTHINYAFATIRDGEIFSRTSDETFRQFQAIQRKHPHIKTLISIGGWGGSGGFSDAALTPVAREKFARSCAAFMIKHRFDGIDIDWEYPGGGGPA